MKKVFLSLAVLACVAMVSCKKAEAPAEEPVAEEATQVVEEAAEAPAEEEAPAAEETAEEAAPAAEEAPAEA